jgi:hypothetical protein
MRWYCGHLDPRESAVLMLAVRWKSVREMHILNDPGGDGGRRGARGGRRGERAAERAAGGGMKVVTATYRSTQLLHTLQCEQRGGR